DRLAAAELDVPGREKEGVPAELEGADLEGDAGAGGALGEDHAERSAGERLFLIISPLHPGGEVENGMELVAGEVGDGEEVALGHAGGARGVGGRSYWQGNLSREVGRLEG